MEYLSLSQYKFSEFLAEYHANDTTNTELLYNFYLHYLTGYLMFTTISDTKRFLKSGKCIVVNEVI